MTTYLERTPHVASEYDDDTPTVPFEVQLPPVVETNDGCTTGQRFNTVVETLVEEAKNAELPKIDGTFLLGDLHGEHLAFSKETTTTTDGNPIKVCRLDITATASSQENLRYSYLCSEISKGDQTTVEFRVHEESVAGALNAGFVGTTDTEKPAEFSGTAAELSTQLAETLIDVVSTKNREGALSNEAFKDIVGPFYAPEVTQPRRWQRLQGKAALFLARISGKHAAA